MDQLVVRLAVHSIRLTLFFRSLTFTWYDAVSICDARLRRPDRLLVADDCGRVCFQPPVAHEPGFLSGGAWDELVSSGLEHHCHSGFGAQLHRCTGRGVAGGSEISDLAANALGQLTHRIDLLP